MPRSQSPSRKAISLAIALAIPVTAAPCRGQTVQGIVVREQAHSPIGRAQLALVDDSGHVVARDTSDSATGAFYLYPPRAGRYRLRIVIGRGGISTSPTFSVDSNQTIERTFAAPDWPRAVIEAYPGDSVTTRAAPLAGTGKLPRYPESMRQANQGGVVRSLFVVDAKGHPDMSTFQIVQSDDERLNDSVRRSVETLKFEAARLAGAPVSQVVEMAFDFGVDKTPPRSDLGYYGNSVVVIRATGVHP